MSFTEMFEKQRAFMLHASTCTSQYDEPHRRLYGEILGLLDEAKQAELERDELMENHQALGREYEAQGRVADKLQADLDAALVLCVASDWDVEVLGAGYEPEVYKAHAHVLPLLEKRREGRG